MGTLDISLVALGITVGAFMAYPLITKISRYSRARAKRPGAVTIAISIVSLVTLSLALVLLAFLALSGSWAEFFFMGLYPFISAFGQLGIIGIALGIVLSVAIVIALALVFATVIGAVLALAFAGFASRNSAP